MNELFLAIEHENLEALAALLDAGADVNQEQGGLTLIHHAVDTEIDGHVQTGEPLHVDTTALLLARGADPKKVSTSAHVSAQQDALARGHWLATELFDMLDRLA